MRLPTLGDEYSGSQMRELVRLLELALNRSAATAAGGSAALSDSNPANLGPPSPGASTSASRADHVHRLPSAGDVGADPAGAASGAIAGHVAASNPHPQYEQFPFSTNLIPAGEKVEVPERFNLLLTRRGIEIRGTLDLRGAIIDVNPSIKAVPPPSGGGSTSIDLEFFFS